MKTSIFASSVLLALVVISCKKGNDTSSHLLRTQTSDTLEISRYGNKKVKEISLSEYGNDKDVKLQYSETGDLIEKTTNFNSHPQHHYEYKNNKLTHQWMEGDIGGCIAITGKESFWDDKGNLTKEISHTSTGQRCSEKVLIHETREYFEGTRKLKSIQYTHESYEGSDEVPCGDWKEYDQTGKLIRQKIFMDCQKYFKSLE